MRRKGRQDRANQTGGFQVDSRTPSNPRGAVTGQRPSAPTERFFNHQPGTNGANMCKAHDHGRSNKAAHHPPSGKTGW